MNFFRTVSKDLFFIALILWIASLLFAIITDKKIEDFLDAIIPKALKVAVICLAGCLISWTISCILEIGGIIF